MKIVMIRSLSGYPDPRVEKELYSISKEHNVFFLGWNRYKNSKKIDSKEVDIYGKTIKYYHFNKKAPIGLGFRKLFFPLLSYWIAEYRFLKGNRLKYDAIHACDFDTVLPALIIAKKYRKKIVYDIFDYYSDAHSCPVIVKKIIKRLEDNVINKCDVTIICSEKRKEQIRDSTPKKLLIIHNSPIVTDSSIMEENIIEDDGKIKLAYIGLLSNDRYLKNIANVIKGRDDIIWHVGGWGPLDSYFKNLSSYYKNIIYYGEIPYSKAIDIERQCNILTALYDPSVPNHKYAAPNKFYESLMLGKPVIMIKGTGMDEYVKKYSIGKIIDLKCVDFEEGFEKAINELLLDNRWKEISAIAKKMYYERFSWSKMEECLLNMYEQI